MLEIVPAILEKDWLEIGKKIELARSFTKNLHIDLIDGKFAPFKTFLDPEPFAKYSKELFFEVHMMVENPIQYLDSFAKAGFKRFIGHIEKMPDQSEFVKKAKKMGEVGLAIDLQTSVSEIKLPLQDLNAILVMAVKAGQSGQPFNYISLKKLKALRQRSDIKIEVDGAMNDQTIALAREEGATRFCVNSFIFKSNNPMKQFEILEKSLIRGGE